MREKILVIDDDPSILMALEMLMEDEGFNVESLSDAVRMLGSLHEKLPDLIILDILLSGRDGRDICRKLKSKEETSHIPIILISAHPNVEQSAMSAGADAFMAKPFDVDDLLAKVKSLMNNG